MCYQSFFTGIETAIFNELRILYLGMFLFELETRINKYFQQLDLEDESLVLGREQFRFAAEHRQNAIVNFDFYLLIVLTEIIGGGGPIGWIVALKTSYSWTATFIVVIIF